MRKTLVLVVAAAVAVIAIVVWRGRMQPAQQAQLEAARAQATAPVATHASGSAAPAAKGVRKLPVAERRELRAQIDRAIRQRNTAAANGNAGAPRAGGSTTASVDDIPTIPLEQVGKAAQDALSSAIPVLAECYPQGSAAKPALAQMVMISDPELGTVIDTSAITGADGATIAPELDECLRDAIESLALPPLGVAGQLPLQYSFRFD